MEHPSDIFGNCLAWYLFIYFSDVLPEHPPGQLLVVGEMVILAYNFHNVHSNVFPKYAIYE